MEGIVTGTVVEVIKCTFDPIKRHVCYFFNHESKVQTLKRQIENLTNARARMQEYVDAATRNGELIFQDVDKWLTSVKKKTTEDVEGFKAHEDKAKGRCFIGLCPNFFSRYHLSKKAEAEAKAVAELLSEGNKLMNKSISHLSDPQQIVSTFVTGFEAFESRRHILEGIMEALKDPNIQRIGLYGMSGVGKTMLVKAVAKKARDEDLFDEVVFAAISNSQMTNIIYIQKQIAEEFGMSLKEETEPGRARRLRQRLKTGRRILIILDDIWKKVDLEAVGISVQEDSNVAADKMTSETFMQNSKIPAAARYKLLLTSRIQDTLCNQMSTEKNFLVETISEEEAMTLFRKIVGNKVEEDGYKSIATDVVKKCAGLPIAISVIANALKNMDLGDWKDALRKLKQSIPADIEEMEDRVYAAVDLSYNYLRSKEAQEIFLLCSLWPQGSDISVPDLIKYSWGLDLLVRVSTLNEARERINYCVSKLKGCGLLLGKDDTGLVKLHDIVRLVCISIGSKVKQMVVVDDEKHMRELLERGEFKTCSAISMPYSDIHKFPSVLECPQLKLLSILSKDSSLKVSDDFFKETNQLKVLNLTGMNLQSLPSSFFFLTNLKMLSLHECKLGDIAIIGRLKKLEILSFLQSNIELLPLELAQLSKLKLLNLSNCSRLKVIPENLISKLCCLEELLMGNSFDGWGVGSNASLMELKHLSHLIALEISIPDAQMMPRSLFSENLKRFKIHIGDVWNERYINDKTSTTLKLTLNTNMYLDHGIQMLLKKSEDIYLDEVKCVKNILSMLERPGIFQLKNLYMESCSELQHVTDSSKGISYVVFPTLESLSLLNLINLEIIHGGRLEAGAFNKLRVIKANSCRKMRNLLSSSMARELHQLQEIEVSGCKNIIEIVESEEEETNDKLEFCSLRLLKITDLPKLITFHCERARNSKSEQENIGAKTEVSLQSNLLFNSKDALPRLEELELRSIIIHRIWDNTASFPSPNLTRLIIQCCSNLRNLFSSRMATSLLQLKRLEVQECQSITEIVTIDYEMADDEISFPNLEFLSLEHLPKLTRFCGNPIKLFSLKELYLRSCPVLVSFVYNRVSGETSTQGEAERKESNENLHSNMSPLFDEKVAVPKLERLNIFYIGSWRRIWGDQLADGSFNNLNHFEMWLCNGLLNIFPITMLGRLQRLSKLSMCGCDAVEEIFKCEEPNLSQRKQPAPKLEISSLTSIVLFELPKLKRFFGKTIECPSLRTIGVWGCSGVELLFASEYLSFQKAQAEEQQQSLQPWFWVNEITFPNLEELTLSSSENLKEVWRAKGQLASQCFPILKNLNLDFRRMDHQIGRGLLLNCFLSFPCLKQLEVRGGSFEEMFQGEVKDLPNTQLSELKLSYLDKVRCLWNDKFEPLFQELTTLEVYSCRKLENLVPASKSLPNLVILDISNCDGLINLLTHSVAKRFLHLTRMRVADCESIEGIIAEDEAKDVIVFPQLMNLELSNLPSLQKFCPSNAPIEFPSLDELIMTRCPRLKIFCQGALSTPKLLKVQVIKTEDEERHRPIERDLNNTIIQQYQEKVGFVGLNDLDFSKFPELIEIWNYSFPQTILEFQNLKHMKLCNLKSNSLRYLLSPSMSMCLVNLKDMKIINCNMIEQVMADAGANEAKTYKIILPRLHSISLKSCPNLTSFCLGSYAFQCPILYKLEITDCSKMVTFSKDQVDDTISESYRLGKGMIEALFNNKVALPKLEMLILSKIESLIRIWGDQLAQGSFNNLNDFSVEECNGLLNIFPITMLDRLQRLRKLAIRHCSSVEEIFGCEEPNLNHGKQPATKLEISSLTSIGLVDLPKLKCFFGKTIECPSLRTVEVNSCSGVELLFGSDYLSFQKAQEEEEEEQSLQPFFWVNEVTLPKLEILELSEIESLRRIWGDQLAQGSFHNLNDFSVEECNGLLNIFPITMLDRLQRLRKLAIRHCSSVEEIFGCEEPNLNHGKQPATKLEISSLTSIGLFDLPKLKCFFGKTIECPSLRTVEVNSCSGVELLFGSDYLSFQKAQEEEEEEQSLQPLFWVNEVSFPILEQLDLSLLSNVKSIWDNQIFINSFGELKMLKVKYCEKLLSIFPSNTLATFQGVEEITIKACHSLQVLLELQGINIIELHAIDTKLKQLRLIRLPKMKHVWDRDFQGVLSLENLRLVRAFRCWNLENLFPISVAKAGLAQLEEVDISFCGLEELFGNRRGQEEVARFEFPSLTKLKLVELPRLKSLYPGEKGTIFCPKLEKLQSFHCGKIKVLGTNQLYNVQEKNVEDQLDLQYQKNPLFCIKEVAFKLRKLSLSNDDIEIINALQFPTSEIFQGITTLYIVCYHDELEAFPFCFLERFPNLEKLVVGCGKFKHLFQCEGHINEENCVGTVLSRIRHLQLVKLGDLRHIQNQNIRHSLILKNLETLKVWFCDTLPSLAPSLASFPNLMKLDVRYCKEMENILAISTCQCLVRLKQMIISECYMVTEIVANHGVEESCEITFSKLELLLLDCLPNLTSFCSGNYSFNFPSLERVYVIGCPGLKIFSERVLNTPRLESVHDGDKNHWAGDLNSTIRQLYTEKVGCRGLGYLDFSRFPELTDLWIDMNPQEKLDFKSLQYLEVCNYNGLQYLFTPSMALGLWKLCSLKVKNCASIEHVITEEGFDGSALVKDVILLPLLESVSLESCPNLTSFYLLGRDAVECLSLNKITVIDCPNMITFASSLFSERKKDAIHEASKEGPSSGKEVDGVCIKSFFTDKVELPSLVHLKLSCVNIPKIWEDSKLSTMSSCVQHLTELIVESCGNLKYLFPSPMVKICAQLETLEIRDSKLMAGVILDDIQRSQDHSEPSSSENHLEFPSMRELVIENCPSLETFITNTLNGADETVNTLPLLDEKVSFPSLERLKLRNICPKVVWHGQYPVPKSLVELRITDCGMIREVMTCAPDEVIGGGIVFHQLKYLELVCLPNLESFSSAQCAFGFPSLVEVTVQDCPSIKTFSRGNVSTPKLKRLQLTESKDEELFAGNLNTTIQDFFAKKS